MDEPRKASDTSGAGLAADLRGFGPLGIFAIVVIVLADTLVKPLSGILALLWAWRSHTLARNRLPTEELDRRYVGWHRVRVRVQMLMRQS
jgi:hypothetical protein